MIKTLYITNPSANTLTLHLGSSFEDEGLLIFNITGLGPPKATVSATGGPTYDGTTVSAIQVDARHVLLTLAIPVGSISEETAKQKVYTYFPIKQEIIFRIETDNKDVFAVAIVESVEANQFAKVENFVISLYFPKPYFLDMVEDNPSISTPSGTTITYDGEVESGIYIDIVFTGYPGGNITITNDREIQSMTLDWGAGVLPGSGDWCRIDTRKGQKSAIYKEFGQPEFNFMNGIGINDDWIKLLPGNNEIAFSPSANTTMNIKFRPIMEGV